MFNDESEELRVSISREGARRRFGEIEVIRGNRFLFDFGIIGTVFGVHRLCRFRVGDD